ncbi:hypothetical protein GS398_03245 [Pedobacter sp. HMF7056]|uniref:Outer membrane beta-barrel protein n=2 Tax=Hufsiella ginkgonis TaxID=2695274 RepID=A0A7K1XTG1_9SPHI|nr:hypothetical protein [Hufsiella ginkgonis]
MLCTIQSFAQGADKKPVNVRFLLEGGLELGGDRVAEIYFTNGETQSVKAGQGLAVAAGGEVTFGGLEKFPLRASVGFKYVTTAADNAHIRLTRVPLQVTANWLLTPKMRFGAGWVSHQAIRFNADGIGSNVSFKASGGPVFELAYKWVGLRYTSMSYRDQFGVDYSANAIGLIFSGVFPAK